MTTEQLKKETEITIEVTEHQDSEDQDGESWVSLQVCLNKGGKQYPIGGKTWSLDALTREGLSIGALEPLCECKTLNELIACGDEMSMDLKFLLGTDAFITSQQDDKNKF